MSVFRILSIFHRLPSPTFRSQSIISFGDIFGVRPAAFISSYRWPLPRCNLFETHLTQASNEGRMVFEPSRNLCSEEERQVSSFNVQDYEDFKERVLNSEKPVVVDFYADWCGPCKMLGPRLEMVIDNRKGNVMLAKVNVDDCGDVAMDYGVRSVPTVIAFRRGQPVDQFIGLLEEEQIDAFINKLAQPLE